MDPDAALDLLLDALTQGDADAARDHFADLAAWLERGGYAPSDPRDKEQRQS